MSRARPCPMFVFGRDRPAPGLVRHSNVTSTVAPMCAAKRRVLSHAAFESLPCNEWPISSRNVNPAPSYRPSRRWGVRGSLQRGERPQMPIRADVGEFGQIVPVGLG